MLTCGICRLEYKFREVLMFGKIIIRDCLNILEEAASKFLICGHLAQFLLSLSLSLIILTFIFKLFLTIFISYFGEFKPGTPIFVTDKNLFFSRIFN
jgi:hypothetical protein